MTAVMEETGRMIQARDVYVLMKKDYRISRNIRASWFFQHLNKTLEFNPTDHLEETTSELQVSSVVGDDGTLCIPGNKYNVALLPSTMVTFVAHRYRFVIILDVSPSVSSVDTSSCSVLYEKVHKALSNFLRGLVLSFQLPGSQIVFTPEVHITVVAYTPVNCFTSSQVLVQGLVVTADNVDKVLSSMAVKLQNFESTLAINFKKCLTCSNVGCSFFDVRPNAADQIGSQVGPQLSKGHDIINSPESGIVNMIRCGMLALQLLPENSSAGLVVVTDGCLGVPDANLFEFLLTQLRTSTISCSFLRIGENRSPFGHFGHIPHTELMQFISTATFGSYFDSCPDVTGAAANTLNVYHKAMLLWSFQRGLEGFRFDLGDQNLMVQPSSSPSELVQKILSHPIHGKLASVMPNLRKRHSEADLNTSLFSVLSVRLREGYTIRDIAITKGETQLEVRLVLPWREYARFEYLVRAAWPLQKSRPVTHIEITSEGIYDFLHDMTCSQMNANKMSGFRSANVMKFWLVLQGLSQTDQLLVHLQSFSSNPVHYTLPGSIKEGVPLFYVPLPNSTVPTLSTQLNSKDPVLSQFASFWRPVVHLDIKVWQKWMHTHRIGLVLEHDIPVNKHIHIPSSSYRYTVMCRQSITTLNLFLTEWSTFVLLDNQSYIKLLFENSNDEPKQPSSFVLVRITSKAPCLVLRLAFLGGTPAYQRYEVVKELKKKVSMLRFPQRGPKTEKQRRSAMLQMEEKETVHKRPLMREWSEIKCCVLLVKPVESILIRYEKMPRDMTKLEEWVMPEVSQFLPYKTQSKSKSSVNLFNSLSKYLLHRRWIWTIQEAGVNSISMQGVGRILSTLTKMRLQQGFHFGLTNQGIVNMMLEVDTKDPESSVDYTQKSKQKPTCVVQYILFPPHTKTTSESLSDEDDEMESTEDDGILQIITECWVEPQHGISVNNTPERSQFEGKSCEQISSVFYPQDFECISSLLTLEHLNYLCQNKLIPSNLSSIVNVSLKPGSNVTKLDPTIEHIQFPFDLLSLLPRSQQAELIYPTFLFVEDRDKGTGKEANNLLYSLFLDELTNSYDRNVILSEEKSSLFMQQLYKRTRSTDSNPFPFKIDNFISLEDEKEAEKSSQSKQSSVQNITATSQSSFSSHAHAASLHNKKVFIPEQPEKEKKDDINIPVWKCLIKHTNSSNLVLTFLPASFEDLIILNETKEPSSDAVGDAEETVSGFSSDVSSTVKGSAEVIKVSGTEKIPSSDNNSNQASDGGTELGKATEGVSDRNKDAPDIDAKSASESEVDDVKDAFDENLEQSVKIQKQLNIPVYTYDCVTQNVLSSLVNPWDFQLPADIFEDMPFESVDDQAEINGLASPKHLKRVSFSAESFKDEDESSWRSSWRSQERRSTEGSYDGGDCIVQQCQLLSELFYNCYIKGVFQSLQKCYNIDGLDVDASINNICEESMPLECNMTSFLHASCCHFQHLVNEARKDNKGHLDENFVPDDGKPHSVRFLDTSDDTDGDHAVDGNKVPGVLEIPKVTLNFDLSLLHLEVPCERVKDLHELIKSKFLDTVNKWFRQIPSSPDYYVYCPEATLSEGISEDRETTASDAHQGASSNVGTLPESDGNMTHLGPPSVIREDRISNASVLDSEESMEDDALLDLDITQDDKSDQSPLFINFTCTVKSRLQQYSMSVKNIAVCIGELSTILEKFSKVGLNDLKITFDLNCLTLPAELDYTSSRKPSMLRMFSNSSMTLGYSSGSDVEDTTDRGSESVLCTKHLLDPIGHLPPRQHDAVTKCMEEIEWLLQDEIVSNLRHISPIHTDCLNYVAKHIQTSCSTGKANVSVDNVPLQFVFGPDRSNEKFTEEFQKMTLQNYQLIKDDEWYYLAKKRFMGFNFINASALNSALTELSQWSGKPGSGMKVQSPSSVSDLVDFKTLKNLSPLVSKDKSFEDGHSPSELKRHSRESSLTLEKKTLTEGFCLDNVSLIGRRRSKELVLKVRKESHDNLSESERRKSDEFPPNVDKEGKDVSSEDGKNVIVKQDKDHLIQTDATDNNIDILDEQIRTSHDVTEENVVSDEVQTMSAVVSSDVESPVQSTFSADPGGYVTSTDTGSHVTSAVQSPVVSDISIKLTKTDGHSEPYRSSPERKEGINKEMTNDSFESDDLENEAVLKRSSSFAGFITDDSSAVLKAGPMDEGHSPLKGPHHVLIGSQLRSRHCSAPVSGQGTPRSKVSTLPYTPSCISSRDSFTEDGVSYDGDMSEMDDSATIFSDSGLVTRMMPNFWLIMHINVNNVDFLLQHRETGRETNEETLELRNLLTLMKDSVAKTCRRVNQQMLLNDLYDTRMCHNLLVDAAEEEVSWNIDSGHRLKPRNPNVSSSENDDEEEDDDTFERKYLAAAMDLSPGYFDCDCVWRTKFLIHPGLKRGTGRGTTMSIGIKALRLVLNPLSVNNRNNMFVIRETATKNVYYLRMKEIQASSARSTIVADESIDGLSLSNQLKPSESHGDRETDTLSLCSSSSALSLSQLQKTLPQDCVELSFHGIDEAGKEIKEDLVQMLQNKLDEATLEKICEMLRRNPQCQLDCHDVMFIQKPNTDPACILHLTVSSRASPQLAAVMYFLRQNLLQFLHTPKYKSSDHQFMDTLDGAYTTIPTDQAFLYIPPLTARKTGIAVVSVCLVDGAGNQVKLLLCPKPTSLAYADIESRQDMDAFVSTQTYELQPNSKRPGPTALIQFHMWQVGDVDLTFLKDRLNNAVKYALCDVLMEYHILTAPICTVPKHLLDMLPTPPTYSAPTSPFLSMPAEDFRERKFSMVTMKKPDAHADRRSSLQNQSRLQSLRDVLIQSTKRALSPTPDSSKVFDLPGVESNVGSLAGSPIPTRSFSGSPQKGESRNLLTLYETGERGTLHRLYSDLLEDWFIHCSQLECPSVHKVKLNLKSRFSVDYILQEYQHIVNRACHLLCTKVYKMLPKDEVDEDTNIGLLYAPNRVPFESGRRRSETSLDTCRHQVVTPGVDLSFTAVSRDLEQWYSFIHGVEEGSEIGSGGGSAGTKGKYPSQKFSAHIPSESETKTFGMFSESTSLIPRQKFLLLTLKNKQVWLYGYNWTNESFVTMSKELTKLADWNNARTHLLGNVVTQKCGLYNHYLASCALDKVNPQIDGIEQLINHPAPPLLSKEKLSRAHSVSLVRDTYLPFDMAFKDLYPNKPLHVSYLTCQSDVVKQYGQQAQDIRLDCKKQFERVNNISKLYVMWVQKMAPNYPISEIIMKQLKQASRLFHYCATPLLFSSKWRKNVLEKFKVNRQDSVSSNVSNNTPDLKSRSRHGSGTSVGSARTKRTDSNELKKRPSLQTFKEFQVEPVDESAPEQEWHAELRSTFIHQYIKYLHTVGFHYVQMDKSQDKGKARKRLTKSDEDSAIPQSEAMEYKPTETHNLQKTVSGGVLLIEISFRDEYFCVKLFTCDHNKLGITVNQQKSEVEDIPMTQELKLLFVDECEKCKELIHVHSFAHDFHLRSIQSYICGENKIFKQGYYLSGLLNDFVKVYAYAPSFSRNFLQREVISIPEPSCSSEDLYDYMLKHSKLHSMSVLKMLLPTEGDSASDHSTNKSIEYALISHESRDVRALEFKSSSPKKMEPYNIGIVIVQDSPGITEAVTGEKPALRLQFYMILTSSQIVYPRQTLDRDSAGFFKRTSSGERKMFGDLKDQIAVKKSVSVREQRTNYLGFSNKHQPPMYQLLQKEAVQVKHKIENMAVVSMDKCRRDNLWMKMLMFKCDETVNKKRSDTDDNKDPLRKQTFEEFKEMLERVHKIPLYEMDPRLLPFVHMSDAWYQGLTQVINKKYTDDVKRCYINPENSAEKHHIIVNPKFLDLFMMLSTDPVGGTTGLYAVFRKPAKEQESICPGGQNVPEQNVQSHMEKFINTCCFYMWTSML